MYDICFLGYGVSNQGALRLFLKEYGGKAFVSTLSRLTPSERQRFEAESVDWEEGQNSDRCLLCQRIVVSPGIPPKTPILTAAYEKGIPVCSDIDFISPLYPPGILTVGITGTNGKTTTVELTAHLLSSVMRSTTVGNIGFSPADLILEERLSETDAVVFELSSFQLYYTHIPFLNIAALLNITTDHLSWHTTFEAYVEAKRKVFALKKSPDRNRRNLSSLRLTAGAPVDFSVGYEPNDSCQITEHPRALKIHTDQGPISLSLEGYTLKGGHNDRNAAFAASIAYLSGVSLERIQNGLSTYKGAEHRLEEFLVHRGVTYVNDSKSTNADSLIQAIKTYRGEGGRLLLLMGGRGKGEDYTSLASEIRKGCHHVFLCGENAPLIAPLIENHLPVSRYSNWTEAIAQAIAQAREGDTVLFSPGGSSFDFFNNYIERGLYFKKACRENLSRLSTGFGEKGKK
ncbi:MAG TPA: UDP-N-acetylmuramoyl-L-alanine--D-glutamate ligase [Thermotogota bacterium]|nr:UDP-N-acetylmuramoyl-L-alanine--D-glutamate ligase [Thermotogota bacterium]OQC30117.1 MAG: UDP-N-acetylmuramoylalanine--D-glutamate ligase [Thermotogota bacterium ADurb.Bin062]HNY82910.1 UDP-N-acetylmuramoyl-L-alanine--D-glutamate ligase [Thermotogota bacterium]HOD92003.1 UDP-N-acetylmuramoyl-L-alanine--D-glutamate ligase [Thermotogota bacterium]HOF24448.1 UDP-N-acetylmuramoyl-L-alanine--D-glutamate ligase [Thermotogota bacterium]